MKNFLLLSRLFFCILFFSIFIVAFYACTVPVNPDEESTTSTTKNTIADIDTANSELIWSPDGNEIFITTKSALKAISVSSKSIRLLDGRPLSYKNMQYLKNGKFLYYRVGVIHSFQWNELYRISFTGGTPQLINNNVEAYVLSPSDSLIAISTRDRHSLVIINMNTGISRSVGFGTPKAFSPDETRLAFTDTLYSNFLQYDKSIGSTYRFPYNLPEALSFRNIIFDVRWDLEGLKIFYGTYQWTDDGYSTYQCAILNVSTGVSTTVPLQHAVCPKTPIWNIQGNRFAVKTFSCAKQFFNICISWYYSIETCVLRQGSSTVYSFGTTAETQQYQPAFSPDGKNLAFFKDGSLMTFQLP
jgi:hypothetical protein